jgi:hypothetical protein
MGHPRQHTLARTRRSCRPEVAKADTLVIMSNTADDPLARWDPRRRAALQRIRAIFTAAGGAQVSLSDELVAERRLAAAAEDGIDPSDPDFGRLLKPPAPGAGSTGE